MITDHMPRIRQLRQEDVDPLCKCAAADDHQIIAPSFVVEKGQQMVGYIGIVPCVLVWLDTKRVHVRDSAMVLNFFENHLAVQNAGVVALPCLEKSPLYKFLPKVGYLDAGDSTLFMKNLTKG